MGSGGPLSEDPKSSKSSSSSEPTKHSCHSTYHASLHKATHHHGHAAQGTSADGRQKRIQKGCERCRIKKIKCDGPFPCKSCEDSNPFCPSSVREEMEDKQLSRGDAEALEHARVALVATICKLYSMVRNQQQWEVGEPELNDRGQPIIYNIARNLGCIQTHSHIGVLAHSHLPEEGLGLTKLARQLEEQQKEPNVEKAMNAKIDSTPSWEGSDRASSSEIDHFKLGVDYRKSIVGSYNNPKNDVIAKIFQGLHLV